MDIGFAGIGRMGRQFALHLSAAGHRVIAFDPFVTMDDELERAGIELAATREGICSTPLTISMLPDPASARELLGGKEGLFAHAGSGHRHVLMGTMGQAAVAELSSEAEHYGVLLADAPVSGTVSAARAKTITTMVGSTDELFAAIQPVLAEFTRAQFHVGELGAGNIVKLAVNVVVGAVNESVNEALLMATRAGVDRELFYEVLRAGAGGGNFVEYKREAFLNPGATGVDAPVTIIHKDLHLAEELAASLGIDLPGTRANAAVLDRAIALGFAASDMSDLAAALERS
jgi:3-hydroxyisobutyrate dehydrogenase-like beta-hydroxyacid dehydrogenase